MPRYSLLYGLLLVAGLASGAFAAAADDKPDMFALLKEEQIGDLRLGLTEKEVKTKIPCKLKKGKEEFWAATGEFVQKWDYPDCGISLNMGSGRKGGAKKVLSITAKKPSPLKTKRGIGIGDPEQEVMKAYGPYQDKEMSQEGQFVAGSVYGGLIFSFEKGRVAQMFLGAAAE